MDAVWQLIADSVIAILPAVKAIGRSGNIFFSLSVAVLSFYWMSVLLKNPDKVRSNKIEDQPQ